MQLDNKEAFKKWLIQTLNPICEAEPDTLASYILALIKKDRSEQELIDLCCRELDVFLLDETKRFVKKLFETLRTKSYMVKTDERSRLGHHRGSSRKEQDANDHDKHSNSHETSKRDARSRVSSDHRKTADHRTKSKGSSRKNIETSHSRYGSPPIRLRKPTTMDEDGDEEDLLSITSSRKRNRSESSDHSSVSRSRGWKSRYHSKTPPTTNNSNFKCPHYEKGFCKYGDACTYQHGEDHIVIDNTAYLPHNYSVAYTPQTSLPNLTKPPPALPFNNPYPGIVNPMPPSFKLPPPQAPMQYLSTPYQLPSQSHIQPSIQENFNQFHPEPYVPMPAHFNQPPPLLSSSSTYLPTQPLLQPSEASDSVDAYNPQNPNPYNDKDVDDDQVSVTSRQSVKRTASEVGLGTSHTSVDKQAKRVVVSDAKNNQNISKKKSSSGSYSYVPNTVLELRKIPPEDNTITNINAHFSKFGIIVNLQINFENDPSAALVAFASAAQASAAHKSKEPFLNNRFIRIFWHNPEKSGSNSSNNISNTASSSVQDKQALHRMKTHVSIPERHLLTLDNTKKKSTGTEGEGETATAAVTLPPRSALKLQRNVAKEGSTKIDKTSPRAIDLKSKKANLDKLFQYSKLLTTFFESAKDSEEKKEISLKIESNMRTMKSLQEDLKALSSKRVILHAPGSYRLNRKLVANKSEEKSKTDVSETDETKKPNEYSRNPFKKVNKALAAKPQSTKTLLKVDRRPRELLVMGFAADEDRLSILAHMKNFGEIEKSGYIEQPASLLVTYKHRNGAEKAISMGTKYKDSTLKIIWWDSLVNKNKNNVSEKNTKEETDLNKENDNGSSSTQQNHDSVSSDATTNVLNKMDHNGEDGGADGKEGNESIKEDPWSNDYLDEFHQYLDYEEDDMQDDTMVDDEEDEDGGRSWRR